MLKLVWKETGNEVPLHNKFMFNVEVVGFNTRANTVTVTCKELGIKHHVVVIEDTPFQIVNE